MTSKNTKSKKNEKLEVMRLLETFQKKWNPSYLTDKYPYDLFTKKCNIEEVSYEENNKYLLVGVTLNKGTLINPNYESKWSNGSLVTDVEKERIAYRIAEQYTDWKEGICPIIIW